jgi:V/A-type H+-transporting ATPase subunit A
MGELVRVGAAGLLGEVIALDGRTCTAQVYEDTTGLAPGETFQGTGGPLSIELGPGLLGGVFDGVGRPLERLARQEGDFLKRGERADTLDRSRLWPFVPAAAVGEVLTEGALLGIVEESGTIAHRILAPPGLHGRLLEIAGPGPRGVADVIARVAAPDGTRELTLHQRWHVRRSRPYKERLALTVPFLTGQRVLDVFFPLPRGGAAGMPGGFGTGKTITQHQLCKWAWADVIVYVGCGERGNEMTHVLRELPELRDPKTGRPLSERTVLIANTSNMPVAAREASLFSGATIAEYFRDMGLHVALLADSTSRWAEALREISGRLEEMPAEEGYPPYLSSRLAGFYERAGRVTTLGGTEGSVTLVSAISPAGGDLTEPVTRHTRRFTLCFWSLDRERAQARVFPAIGLADSYGSVSEELTEWWSHEGGADWEALRRESLALLQEASRLERTARLIGAESLPEKERFTLRLGSLLEEGFLRQSAFDPKDSFCSPRRQVALLRLFARLREGGLAALSRGVTVRAIFELPIVARLERAKSEFGEEDLPALSAMLGELDRSLQALAASPEAAA